MDRTFAVWVRKARSDQKLGSNINAVLGRFEWPTPIPMPCDFGVECLSRKFIVIPQKKNVHTDQDTLNVANLENCRDWLEKNHNEKQDLTHPQHYLSTPVVSIEGFVVATNSRGSQKDIPLHCRGRARLRTGLSYYNLIKRICVYAEHLYHGI